MGSLSIATRTCRQPLEESEEEGSAPISATVEQHVTAPTFASRAPASHRRHSRRPACCARLHIRSHACHANAQAHTTLRKIDVFNHIFPEPYVARMRRSRLASKTPASGCAACRCWWTSTCGSGDGRVRRLQRSCRSPRRRSSLRESADAVDLARRANDGMAELVAALSDRFPGFVASLPLNDPDAAMRRSSAPSRISGARHSNLHERQGKPLVAPEFLPLFDAMAGHDLPIWLHPYRGADSRLPAEDRSHSKSGGRSAGRTRPAWRWRGSSSPASSIGFPAEDHHAPHGRDGAVPRGAARSGMDQLGARTSTWT